MEHLIENKENSVIDEDLNNDGNVDINTDYLENENQNNESQTGTESKPDNTIKKNYIGYLEIPKISLKYGFVSKDSYYNHVDRNIQIINESDFPNVKGGNFIIAGHSGTSAISYFKNLYLLKVGDIAKVIYKNHTYTYKIVNIYKDDRDGIIKIIRDETKTTLTLITCSYKDKKNQTVYIAELQNIV